jgi:hypothetical protein
MNKPLLTLCIFFLGGFAAHAQAPSLINYQGRLSDANGAPVTGSKNFVIRLYDAQTGGTLLYTEDLGSVSLGTNGIYSFQFGSAGSSNALTSETVATTNGTSTTFQKVLSSSPVVAGSVSVSDGTYSWSEASGSSDEQNFGVSYSSSLRRVTVNYYSGPPASGRNITATYRAVTNGISGALAGAGEHWMELSVDGTIQGTRQRVLAVPFAAVASYAENATDSVARLTALASTEAIARYSGDSYTTISGSLRSVGNQFGEVVTSKYEGSGGAAGDYVPPSPLLISSAYVGYYGTQSSLYGSITFHYADGTDSTLSWTGMLPNTESDRTMKNPNPEKLVRRVSGNQYYEYWYAGVRSGNAMIFTLQTLDTASIKFSGGRRRQERFSLAL